MGRGRGRGPVARVEWTADDFDRDRALAIDAFRRERLEEPLEDYLAQYDGVERVVSAVLREYRAALAGDRRAADMLVDPAQREVLRYLAGPPISMDDLKVLADAPAISARSLAAHPSIVARIRIALDPRRFPWLVAGRDPTDAESHAAVVATTALIASQRVATRRRTLGKQGQDGVGPAGVDRDWLHRGRDPRQRDPDVCRRSCPGTFHPRGRPGSGRRI